MILINSIVSFACYPILFVFRLTLVQRCSSAKLKKDIPYTITNADEHLFLLHCQIYWNKIGWLKHFQFFWVGWWDQKVYMKQTNHCNIYYVNNIRWNVCMRLLNLIKKATTILWVVLLCPFVIAPNDREKKETIKRWKPFNSSKNLNSLLCVS